MNWGWHRQKEVLKTDKATQAESRLAAIKKGSSEHQSRWKDHVGFLPSVDPNPTPVIWRDTKPNIAQFRFSRGP